MRMPIWSVIGSIAGDQVDNLPGIPFSPGYYEIISRFLKSCQEGGTPRGPSFSVPFFPIHIETLSTTWIPALPLEFLYRT